MRVFADAGWRAIGVDRNPAEPVGAESVIHVDIGGLVRDAGARANFAADVRKRCDGAPLGCIINNAAVQRLGKLEDLAVDDIIETMDVNVVAPMLLVRAFLPELRANSGAVVNIGSVHAQATKPNFSAYATSKSALHGLTRALSVDLGPEVRVNTLAPAATATPMLKAGFENDDAAFAALENVHPLRRIAEPAEIARIALFLASEDASFLTGATVFADGGVLSRLHDPA
ncbi:MAG: SDR family oxidoreductase [Alphaproteobacteria bacterium]|nr:SDR family oxidoreductase [Alphaproteobacteria bacterium]